MSAIPGSPPAVAAAAAGRRLNLHNWAMAGVLLALWAVLGALPQTSDFFLTQRNLANLTVQIAHIVIVAVGMTLVILIGGIDLSVGAGVALTGTVAALLQIDHGMPVWVAIGAALATGLVLGLWQGFWIARFKIPAFVVTLAGFNAFRGLSLVLSNARGLSPMRDDFSIVTARLPVSVTVLLVVGALVAGVGALWREGRRRKKAQLSPPARAFVVSRVVTMGAAAAFFGVIYAKGGMPVPVLLAALAVLGGIVLTKKTRFGRHVYAIGGSAEAARLSGIDVPRVTLGVYVIVGLLTAVAGLILAGRVNGVTPGNAGNLLELDVITAVVIGGTSLSGGRGSVVGSLLGAMVFGTLSNGMNLLEVDSNWQLILKGLILMTAVLIDVLTKRRSR